MKMLHVLPSLTILLLITFIKVDLPTPGPPLIMAVAAALSYIQKKMGTDCSVPSGNIFLIFPFTVTVIPPCLCETILFYIMFQQIRLTMYIPNYFLSSILEKSKPPLIRAAEYATLFNACFFMAQMYLYTGKLLQPEGVCDHGDELNAIAAAAIMGFRSGLQTSAVNNVWESPLYYRQMPRKILRYSLWCVCSIGWQQARPSDRCASIRYQLIPWLHPYRADCNTYVSEQAQERR